jgi:hypothetical protein
MFISQSIIWAAAISAVSTIGDKEFACNHAYIIGNNCLN